MRTPARHPVLVARLFADPVPPLPPSIDLRRCDVAELLADVSGAALVHADPPWTYRTNPANSCSPQATGHPQDIYSTLSMNEIRRGARGHVATVAADPWR